MCQGKTSDAIGGICFSGTYNEQRNCEAGGRALKARVCESKQAKELRMLCKDCGLKKAKQKTQYTK